MLPRAASRETLVDSPRCGTPPSPVCPGSENGSAPDNAGLSPGKCGARWAAANGKLTVRNERTSRNKAAFFEITYVFSTIESLGATTGATTDTTTLGHGILSLRNRTLTGPGEGRGYNPRRVLTNYDRVYNANLLCQAQSDRLQVIFIYIL
jgi:hypothetical protein